MLDIVSPTTFHFGKRQQRKEKEKRKKPIPTPPNPLNLLCQVQRGPSLTLIPIMLLRDQ